ncbi:peptide/nickel transport system substrate-binding protein [Streptococcus henryi]|uniref:Peptide/nickel transport system substrate-binding protein n=1 Tax=Streptococcus henryi TaxID=439219 RepID=A0A1G6DM21_9STRE|nr:ABC transporter substrate-binding protein [Streptococcus henryi]SDB46172.1 peptide/nickel transport system substrate-binding protein [Streptococcus henryi]
MKRKNNKKSLYAIIAAVVLVIVAGIAWLITSNSSSKSQSAEKSSVTYAFGGEPVSVNPINSNDLWGLKTINMIYSPLLRTANDGTITYELATSVEQSEDGKTITVDLRDDVLWSDGEPFTADDVVFTYTQKAKKENGKYESLWVGDKAVEVEKIDDHTVQFNVPEPSAAALNNLSNETYIIPEHIYSDTEDLSINDLGKYPTVGTGPYVLEDFTSDGTLTLTANPNYYGGDVKVDTVNARIISNSDTLKVALQNGEVDLASIESDFIDDLEGSDTSTVTYSSGAIDYLGINSEIITDQRIRQAIFYALDRQELNTAGYLSEDYYLNAYSFLPSDNAYFYKDTEDYAQNIEKEKQLLEDSGAKDLTFTLAYDSSDDQYVKYAAVIQEQLAQIGIKVTLEGGDAETILAELKTEGTKKYALFICGYSMGNDPDTYKRLFQTGGASNYFKLASDKIDGLFTSGATQLDKDARQKVYDDLQVSLAEEAVIYPITSSNSVFAVNNRVSGIEADNLYPIYTIGDWSVITAE